MTSVLIMPVSLLLACSLPFALSGKESILLWEPLGQCESLGPVHQCVPSFWTVMLDSGVGQTGRRHVSSMLMSQSLGEKTHVFSSRI